MAVSTTGEEGRVRIMMLDLAKLSARNLTRRGKRSWLTVIGILIGIAAIVALLSLSQGLQDSVSSEFEDLGANTIYIMPGSGVGGLFGGGLDETAELDNSDLKAIRRVRGVNEAGPVIFYLQNTGKFRGEVQRLPLVGVPTDSSQEMVMETNSLVVDKGRNIRDNDKMSGIVGSKLTSGGVYEREVRLRGQLEVEDFTVRVIGTMEQSGDPEYDRSLVLPIESVRQILDDEDRIDYIVANTKSGQSPKDVAEDIEKELRDERGLQKGDEDFSVSTADDLLESSLGILDSVQYVVIGIVSIALFVGGLGIMNTMYMSVSERTKEIGIMKALGATKRQILTIYLVESGILGLIGGFIGVVIGLSISEVAFYVIRRFAGIPLQPTRSLGLIGGALAASFFFGIISGVLPARKAAGLEPVEAIRKE